MKEVSVAQCMWARAAVHGRCIPNMPSLLHVCWPLVQKSVFLGRGRAMVSVVCSVHVPLSLGHPWLWPGKSALCQIHEPCPCPTSLSPPAGALRREGGALPVSILIASRGGGVGSPGELLQGAGVQVGWAGGWDGDVSPILAWRSQLSPGLAVCGREIYSDNIMFCAWK